MQGVYIQKRLLSPLTRVFCLAHAQKHCAISIHFFIKVLVFSKTRVCIAYISYISHACIKYAFTCKASSTVLVSFKSIKFYIFRRFSSFVLLSSLAKSSTIKILKYLHRMGKYFFSLNLHFILFYVKCIQKSECTYKYDFI